MAAMSEAVDNAACFLYGVSLEYKQSANCRLVQFKFNYPHQSVSRVFKTQRQTFWWLMLM